MKKGFTLIELLITVAIIAILAAIIIPNVIHRKGDRVNTSQESQQFTSQCRC